MPAYLIVFNKVNKPETFQDAYAKRSVPLVAKAGGKYRIVGYDAHMVEGPDSMAGAATIVAEFPDRESILRFWESEEYQEAKKARANGVSEVIAFVTDAPWMNDEEAREFGEQMLR